MNGQVCTLIPVNFDPNKLIKIIYTCTYSLNILADLVSIC